MKTTKYILLIIVFAFFTIKADRRYFSRTYLANTLPANSLEMEIWNTGKFGKNSGYYYRFQPRIEFEYGVTDKLTTSMYFNFNQITSAENSFSSKSFSFSSTSVEIRYRLSEINEFIVDPAVYFEFYYGGEKIEYEEKLILSKRFGNFITAFNLTSEIERLVIKSSSESSIEFTAGMMYDVSNNFALGFEFKHHKNFKKIFENEESNASFLGPTLNILTDRFYLTINFLSQIFGSPKSNSSLDLVGHEKYEFRTILGIGL